MLRTVLVAALGAGMVVGPSKPHCNPAQAEATKLERSVEGQTLTSGHTPAVSITFDKAFRYVGGQRFILYDVANAEQHFFVDADAQRRIRGLYWIQFEGYLPNNEHTYRYQSRSAVNIGGLDFIADAWARSASEPSRPKSDGEYMRVFLEGKGYALPQESMRQRLVHLTDASKRNELMIIYLEDLAPTAFAATDLAPGGRAADSWPAIARGLLERTQAGLRLTSTGR